MTVHDTETWPWHEVRVHDSETEAHAHALKVSRELGVEVAVIPCETQPTSHQLDSTEGKP
jgi:hypothetical protein